MELGRRSGRKRTSGKKSLPPVNRSTTGLGASQRGSPQHQKHHEVVLGYKKNKVSKNLLRRRQGRRRIFPATAHGGARPRLGCQPRRSTNIGDLVQSPLLWLHPTPRTESPSFFLLLLSSTARGCRRRSAGGVTPVGRAEGEDGFCGGG